MINKSTSVKDSRWFKTFVCNLAILFIRFSAVQGFQIIFESVKDACSFQ